MGRVLRTWCCAPFEYIKILDQDVKSRILRGRRVPLILLACALSFSLCAAAQATDIILTWNTNSEPDIAGYKLYYGTANRTYDHVTDVGNVTTYTLLDLGQGTTYYFAVTAYDTSGNESGFSTEVTQTIAAQNHQPNKPTVPSGPSNGYPNTGYDFITSASDPDGDLLDYRFDWDDGTISAWGAASQSHSWSSAGTYCVKAQAEDPNGATSGWSDCKNINIAVYTYSITASAGPHGNISPSGNVIVNDGADQTFSISPAQGYYVSDVLVDDASVGATTLYTFKNVARDHKIVAAFALNNQPPIANAGADQSALVNDTATLDGSGSSDADGDSLTLKWSFISKPSGSSAALSSTSATKPTFVVDAPGNYVLQLIVNDGQADSQPDSVTISTNNSPPVANAGADQTKLVNDTVTLDGSGSSDADGNTLSFSWSFVSKPNGSTAALSSTSAAKPNFVVDAPGNYVVQLIVNDGTADSQPDSVTISTDNSPPVANAGADQTKRVNDTVTLDGSGSNDADGDSLTFNWSFVSKPNGSSAALSSATAAKPGFVVDAPGNYVVQLIVNDGTAHSQPDTVTISTDNSPPVANAGADQTKRVNDTVTLDGSGSSDADGDTLSFSWSFVSKPNGSSAALSRSTAAKPAFVVDAPGNYVVQLIVNDGQADSQPDSVTVSTDNSPPVANAGTDQTAGEGDTVTLSGANSFDPDDNIHSYSWNQTNGPAVTLTNINLTDVNFTAPDVDTDGTAVTFQLAVNDSEGLQNFDSCIVYVNKAAARDSDNDGVPDEQDAFPSDPTETIDTDGDGIGNNADKDDDNDGMPDDWEIQYGLDPLVDDASEDADLDGVSNLDEFLADTDPIVPRGNSEPDSPALIAPPDQELVTFTPMLQVDGFYDPDPGDVHSETQWHITRQADDVCVLDVTSLNSLNALEVPGSILQENTRYTWKARFYDSHGAPSEWSEPAVFITQIDQEDSNGNGIPDDFEADATSDMDEDGTLDIDQNTIKCVKTKDKTSQIGISFQGSDTVSAIEHLAYKDPMSLNSPPKEPDSFPFGLIDFRLLVDKPGDQAEITVYFSDRIPEEAKWYKYDPIESMWLDYSAHVVEYGANRKSITLLLEDGGMGDADGIANGIIVDPSGFSVDVSGSSGATGGSCFISASFHGASTYQKTLFLRSLLNPASVIMILVMIVMLAAGRFLKRKFISGHTS